ncbi:CGNR zinc finger domain-containing protein [Myceligenerans pegani]|uniref:CGNR zinc finger domain-containing protein n=1 Tax=Myceligenerans pegani TaxID=2776917 RepID=A0ABR9N229_9MICO|nr:CGNR zinc finger domain-containing protein [Myceligenerans sp. TRM 65318]MBE1877698.1 CGNR zinc finger domain-containing protein [Myceligenerans sp. TRM 65318]MBE3019969.1 CGNR zinc finger domain-containing protein [Myceligenerans sp. TRM 65318]
MLFEHDTEPNLRAAVALVNSAEPPRTLETVADLDAFYTAHGYTVRHDGDEAELAAVQALIPRLRELLTADRDTAAELANRILADVSAVPRLVRHGETDWHLHSVPDDAPFADHVAAETALAMTDLIRADEMSRLSVCADPTCEGLVLDLSRNRSRKFCSTRCSNRAAVAAYRDRRRA